ncbi:aspartate/glutamate racemase family protein [Mailhella massiliensis]|uniref:aspartate/glutamate racemase family protein n=1 Tax=Mailhella massiliensis TaxID=1903261 RepID=UPI001EF5DCA8|nr:amino acid racemase [Mailhella massiliensis]
MIQRVAHHEMIPLPIGIVGGLGPYAGYDLLRKIFRWTEASTDQEHLPIMLHSFPGWIPERPAYLLGQKKENPGEDIGDIMVQLARNGARVIGMPCNTAHSPRILDVALERLRETGLDVTFVSIIESAVKHVSSMCPNGGRIGLMGTVATLQTRLYQDALEKAGLEPVLPDDEDCALVQRAISDPEFGVKAFSDPVSPKARQILLDTARRLVEKKQVSAILLGCTEIPVAVTESVLWDTPVVDATSVLARELIRASCPERLKNNMN